ncbi:MAG: four-carbon acid sugar kinase family protein [Planctomycetota bacterium]
MNDHRLGCIADDVTGATDLASMLARGGYRVVQCFGVPDSSAEDELSHADVIVVALKSRSVPADQAVAMSLSALAFLHSQSIQHVYFKYCSTFDSTPAGNIGPVADALAEACHADDVIFCPAFPENGRTVINGQLLVHGVPIDQTGMRHHPLNPMTDADLVRVLQAQSNRNVVREDMPADATHGNNAPRKPVHRIVDAQDDSDLKRIAQSAAEHRLMTGGSAVASYWGRHHWNSQIRRGREPRESFA